MARVKTLLLLLALATSSCTDTSGTTGDSSSIGTDEIRLICDQAYMAAFTELVASADDEVLIIQWEFFGGEATAELIEVMAAAVERGVHVQVLLDDDIEENEDAIQWMTTRGIDAILDFDDSIRLHAKMVIKDSDTVMLGSTNWSNPSIRSNRECNVLAHRPEAAAYLKDWYQGLKIDPGDREPPQLNQGSLDFTALVDDQLLSHLLSKIDSAETSIDFTLYATWLQPNDPSAPAMQVFDALAAATERGVTVRGIADYSDWNQGNNDSNEDAVQWLRARGVEMRWEDAETTTHAKIFRIDSGLQVQSANISSGGLRWNREVAAWTTYEHVIRDINLWFENLWETSTLHTPGR
jgi:phosphatidylserine/phosphatidylglycerophosphate/cardiolipin synthase-like enzyme